MRYCSHCGSALNVGASFCHNCGASLKAFVPEADETPAATPVVEEPVAEEPTPVVIPTPNNKELQEEKAFLDQTLRLLRWERKAWSIAGKALIIMGIVFAAIYFLIGVVFLAVGEEVIGLSILFFMYCLILGGMFLAIGIVNRSVAGKIPQYTDTLYKDFRAAHTRCNSVGMIVLCAFFNNIALVFYLINFIRMKRNKAMVERILTRQGVK